MYRGSPRPNSNGGVYQPGRRYDINKKLQVAATYNRLVDEVGVTNVTVSEVARRAKVSWGYADSVVEECQEAQGLMDPMVLHEKSIKERPEGLHLPVEEEVFLLSLRAEKPSRPNIDYIKCLFETYGRLVSSSFISRWFKKRFEFPGDFKKPNLVRLDKWRPTNIAKFLEYRMVMDALPLHHMWNFVDEKHLVNKDCMPGKGRADPLTGYMDAIPVLGDFRQTYNLMAVISGNPDKPKNIAYNIDTYNGDCIAFYCFITHLIETGFFKHGEVLVMDNGAIHTGGVSRHLEELLWDTEINGSPLNVLVVYLPTRSPKLNPIELIFHILARRIRSYRYEMAGATSNAVLHKTMRVLDDISYELILKCYAHCGY